MPQESASPWLDLVSAAGQLVQVATQIAEEEAIPNSPEVANRLLPALGTLHLLVADVLQMRNEVRIQELQELAELKSDQLRFTVHELRRPLALIHGHMSLLLESIGEDLPEISLRSIQQIKTSVRGLSDLIDDLEKIAQLEDRAHFLQRDRCRLSCLVGEAIEAIKEEASAKGIRIALRFSAHDPEITADRDRLRAAIVNLLANAVKYSPEASLVTVSVGRKSPAEVEIAIKDQGPGMEPSEVEKVMSKWYRVPGSDVPGLGLGLYLVHRIAELHGGQVKVITAPGNGSTFSLVLPLDK